MSLLALNDLLLVSGNNQKAAQTTRVHLILESLHFVHASFCALHLQKKKKYQFLVETKKIFIFFSISTLLICDHSEIIPL